MIHQGLLYVLNSLSLDPLTLSIVLVGLIVSCSAPRREWAVAAGILAYLAYVVAIGGDFMSGRMFTPIFVVAVLQILACHRESPAVWFAAMALTLFVGLTAPRPPVFFEAATTFPEEYLIEPTGIADERLIYHQQGMGLLLTQRGVAARHPFIKLGLDARTGPRVVSAMTVGMMGYYAGPAVHIVDVLALAEPLLARLPAAPHWRIGHYMRGVPEGYLETLETGRNTIRDSRVAMLYEKVALITRGSIWEPRRLRAIVSMGTGGYDDLMDAESP
jgi:arabinofuranosyltransferase